MDIKLPTKFEQVAYYADKPATSQRMLSSMFGMTEWVQDTCVANGYVFGRAVKQVVADLWFNYQMGFEYELLHYHGMDNWHRVRGRGALPGPVFLSHMGMHVQNMEEARAPYEAVGLRVAQELWTMSHSNPYLIEKKRTYHYVVFDSLYQFGFDLKLIQRIEAKGASNGR